MDRVKKAKLFFPEETPELIAQEAMQLWGVRIKPSLSVTGFKSLAQNLVQVML